MGPLGGLSTGAINDHEQTISVLDVERKATGKEIVELKYKTKTTNKDKCFYYFEKIAFLRAKDKAFFNPELDSGHVKGRLRKRLAFWERLGANEFVLDTIKNGYKLPFIHIPRESYKINNKTAIDNADFVSDTIIDLIDSGSVIEVPFKPIVVNPLSVAFNSSGKPRLILDLRFVNEHLLKEHIKFDDWRVFEQFVEPGGFVFKFDLRKGYHHIDILPEHQNFLGFSWKRNGKEYFYVFTVLPFGLSTAPAVFTKVLRPLISSWHKQGIKIAVYLDDGFGIASTFEKTFNHSKTTKNLLMLAGLVTNDEKSEWNPSKSLTWLGVTVDLNKNTYQIAEERISSLLKSLFCVLKSPYTTARKLSRIAGKIVSTKFVLKDIIRLKTRSIYKTIDNQLAWDSRFNILNYPSAHKEIIFWRDNIKTLNERTILKDHVLKIIISSDASDKGIGAICESKNLICHKSFNFEECDNSSTWRELEAIRFALLSFEKFIRDTSVKWFTDNRAAMYICRSGSSKDALQLLALQIYDITKRFEVKLEVEWIPREQNDISDFFSKIIDPDDWEITDSFFEHLDELWGPFTIDRFASSNNNKAERFNSKYAVPDTEAVDAFTQDWRFDNNLLVPPVSYLIKTINYLKKFNIRGALIAPYWPAAPFWACLRENGSFASFITDWIYFSNTNGLLKLGNYRESLLGSDKYKGGLIALKIRS